MPGYMIHLAVGKVYAENNKIEDIKVFEKGIIDPDMIEDKSKSHYGSNSSRPDLDKYIEMNGISNSYKEGYFLHLVTDYLFYNRFLKHWNISIYEDYDILNARIAQKYGITTIPKEIQTVVKFKNGKLTLLNEEELNKFITTVGNIDIREIVKAKEDIKSKIDDKYRKVR